MPYAIKDIAALVHAEHLGHTDGTVKWLLTDSRSLCFPEETLFFDDSQKNIDAAAELGFQTQLIPPGTEFYQIIKG